MPIMYGMDPLFWLIFGGTLLLSIVATLFVKASFAHYRKVPASSGATGAQAARRMLDNAGLTGVEIQRVGGFLSDHYDPRRKVIRLSPEVYEGRSVASLAVACHEAGHAVQDAKNYAPLVIRNAAVPMAGFGSSIGYILIFIGLILNMFNLALLGLGLFACVVFFQLVNLPVEFNASTRAKQMLPQLGLISGPREAAGVNRVLNAAALTYVAATITALLYLMYYAMIIFGRRN